MSVLYLTLMLLSSCAPPSGDKPSADSGAPPVQDADPFRIATFNIDWLSPRTADPEDQRPRNSIDHQLLHSLITEHSLDLVALQEIEGSAAVDVLRFDDPWAHVVGESGWSQNLALLYRSDLFTVDEVREVQLPGTDWPDRFPLVANVEHIDGLRFTAVVVHHSAYATGPESAARYNQAGQLRTWLDNELRAVTDVELANNVVVLGDFNDDFAAINADYPSLELLESGGTWRFATRQSDGPSSIGFGSIIDHIVLSQDMVPRWTESAAAEGCHVIRHDQLEPWASYSGGYGNQQNISSHRPVWLSLMGTP